MILAAAIIGGLLWLYIAGLLYGEVSKLPFALFLPVGAMVLVVYSLLTLAICLAVAQAMSGGQ